MAVLLAEPQRWFDVQDKIHLTDFTEETRRKLAEIYWQHHQDEGEPKFSELLGTLTEQTTSDLAIELIEEFDTFDNAEARLNEAIALMKEMGGRDEQQKLLAELRRTNDAPQPSGDDDPLRKLQEKARRPDLRRVGN